MKDPKNAYFVGIKGVGMTALAVLMKQSGWNISGSDVPNKFLTDEILQKYKIPIYETFSSNHIKASFNRVIVSGAHGGRTNIEAKTAEKLGIPVYMHGKALGLAMKNKFSISVAGSHGKTTTSAMVAFILELGGLKPSYAIGTAGINKIGTAGHYGNSSYFIAEADEYMTCPVSDPTPRFLWQEPNILVVTNIEFDHPDAYKNLESVTNAFQKFTQNIKKDGLLIGNIDNPQVRTVLSKYKGSAITYGFDKSADAYIKRIETKEGESSMTILFRGTDIGQFSVSVPGKHNLLNALAAILVSHQVGLSWDAIRSILPRFTGTKRRFEYITKKGSVLFYDDYAHHPTEIAATISATKQWFPRKKLTVIFQPHTYSRTKALLPEFAKAFQEADKVIITEIFPSAREKYDSTITSAMIVNEISKIKPNAIHLSTKKDVLAYLRKSVISNELIMTMGAGDVYEWHKEIKAIYERS